jgi:hypothetical protein
VTGAAALSIAGKLPHRSGAFDATGLMAVAAADDTFLAGIYLKMSPKKLGQTLHASVESTAQRRRLS